jgi:elongation factor P--(R)-beta-lysine ligase
MSDRIRGRVIARDGDALLIRTGDGDVKASPAGRAGQGDLVEIAGAGKAPRIVRAYLRGEYPTPETETSRLSGRRRDTLHRRATALAAVRSFFTDRGFLEIETPLLVPAPGLEIHIRAVPAAGDRWLITSPEYQMKRLLAGGLQRIFTLCKCFRAGEEGQRHSTEFTMLEWYRAWARLGAVMTDTEELVAHVARAVTGEPAVRVGDRVIDVTPPWDRLTVAEVMDRFAGVTLEGDERPEVLRGKLEVAGLDTGTATAWDDLFYGAFVDRIEPALAALDRPVFVVDWPVRLGALARRKPKDPRLVERFEAYVGGIELANAFGELTDPVEQRSRFEDDRAARSERGLEVYPVDEKLIAALEEGLPFSAGIALGIDRLIMLVTGAAHIREVLAFTTDEL